MARFRRRTIVTSGRVVQVFGIDPAGYSSASARPYDSIKLLVKKVCIDPTIGTLGLTNCSYWFSGCSSLKTIYADSTWALPSSGISGSQCFYQCSSLVGGNGTRWSSSCTGYQYMRIDTAGASGYITSA